MSPREETQRRGSGQEEEGAVCAQPVGRKCGGQVFSSDEEVNEFNLLFQNLQV